MGIVAVHTVVAGARSTLAVPVTVHAAVRAMLVVAILRSVALRTQRKSLGHGKNAAIGEVNAIMLALHVARRTCAVAVFEDHVLMKGRESIHRCRQWIAPPQGMAGLARDPGWCSAWIRRAALDARQPWWIIDEHGVRLTRIRQRYRFARRTGFTAQQCKQCDTGKGTDESMLRGGIGHPG